MRSRLRNLARLVCSAIASEIGRDELALAVSLGLLARGCWLMPSWQAAAYLAPAIVLLWVFLPQRSPFIHKPPQKGA